MTFDYTEFNKLCAGLIEKGYNIQIQSIWSGRQVIVNDEQNIRQWDAVIHESSYGREDGLLEVYGTIVDKLGKYNDWQDTVVGYLTAEQILEVC